MSIEFLSDIDHVRKRPEMYTGTTETIYPLVREIMDNAIDEIINEFGNSIYIRYNSKANLITIKDNGRGIPVNENNYKDIPVLLATKLFSGGKFDKKMYSVTTGLHGVGLTVVNALSSYMKIITKIKSRSKKKYMMYVFKDSELIYKEQIYRQDIKWSTIISFIPNTNYVEPDLDRSIVKERLDALKTIMEKVKIDFIWDKRKVKLDNIIDWFKKNKVDLFGEYSTTKTNKFIIGYKLSETQRYFYGLVNTLPVHKGTHFQELEYKIKKDLFKIAQRQKRHIKEQDLSTGLRIFMSIVVNNISFAAQHKNELTTKRSELETIFKSVDITKILSKEQINQVLDRIESYRLNLEARKSVRSKKTSKGVHVDGLRDTNNKLDPELRELYIVEGESAGGTAISVRDVSKHAILPLRGKIQNPLNTSKALQSEITQRIFKALGVQPLSNDLSSLRYGKIFILTDPDPDGYHISLLLVALFELLLPDLVKAGKLFIIKVPLYGRTIGNKFTPYYEEPKNLKLKGLHRFKGLGEMDPDELYYVALDENTRKVIQVKHSEADQIKNVMKEK